MKILIITGTLPPAKCGVGDYAYRLIKALRKSSLDIDVITDERYSIEIGAFPVNSWKTIPFCNRVAKFVKKGHYDIVHIQYPSRAYKRNVGINLLPIWLKLYTKVKLVFTTHEYYQVSRMGKWRQLLNVLLSDAVITVDRQSHDVIKKMSDAIIKCIPISSNIEKSSGINTQTIRASLMRGKTASKVMVHFGFIIEDRQFLQILEALNRLKKSNSLHTLLLVIGELKENDKYHLLIKRYIDDNQLGNDVFFTGYLASESVADYIEASDFGIALYKNGLAIRHGSYLALRQEGLLVISSFPDGSETFADTIFTFSEVGKIATAIETLQNRPTDKSFNRIKSWDEVAREHKDLYLSLYSG